MKLLERRINHISKFIIIEISRCNWRIRVFVPQCLWATTTTTATKNAISVCKYWFHNSRIDYSLSILTFRICQFLSIMSVVSACLLSIIVFVLWPSHWTYVYVYYDDVRVHTQSQYGRLMCVLVFRSVVNKLQEKKNRLCHSVQPVDGRNNGTNKLIIDFSPFVYSIFFFSVFHSLLSNDFCSLLSFLWANYRQIPWVSYCCFPI